MIACLAALCITGAVAVDGDTLRVNTPGKPAPVGHLLSAPLNLHFPHCSRSMRAA